MPQRFAIHMKLMAISFPVLLIILEDHSASRTADLRSSRELAGASEWIGHELGVPSSGPFGRIPGSIWANARFLAVPSEHFQ